MSTEAILTKINEIAETVKTQGDAIEALRKPQYKNGTPAQLLGGAPRARHGEDPMSSRGYSYAKLLGLLAGQLGSEDAKLEIDVHNKLQKHLLEGTPFVKASSNSIMAPFSTRHMSTMNPQAGSVIREVDELVKAGPGTYDPAEALAVRQKYWGLEKAMSWVDDPSGGALVGPPVFGELIDILRNNEAFLAAGAREIGMPPTGRITFPRQTDVSTAYWVGESDAVTESQATVGDLVLTAKKLAALCRIPNELFRFASVGVEQFVRDDIAKVLSLQMDLTFLESPGSAYKPKGLLYYTGITSHTAGTTGTDGDTLTPSDPYDMVGKVEEKNAEFKSWIMRPLMFSKLANRRADAATAGDKAGMFLFDVLRGLDAQAQGTRGTANLVGYPVVKSTQVSNTRVKGAGTALTYILGGDFSDFIIAMGGVIEFALNTMADTAFTRDQTLIRAIAYCDGAPRREASFVKCDSLLVA
jgi:HK97 family phage major capsid protein